MLVLNIWLIWLVVSIIKELYKRTHVSEYQIALYFKKWNFIARRNIASITNNSYIQSVQAIIGKTKNYKYAYLNLRVILLSRSLIASMSLEKYFVCCLSKATGIDPNSVIAFEIFPLRVPTFFVMPSTPKFRSSSNKVEIFHIWSSSDLALLLTFY